MTLKTRKEKKRKSSYLINELKNFNEIFWKNMSYNNIRSCNITKSRASTTFFKENFYENYKPFKDELKFFEIA